LIAAAPAGACDAGRVSDLPGVPRSLAAVRRSFAELGPLRPLAVYAAAAPIAGAILLLASLDALAAAAAADPTGPLGLVSGAVLVVAVGLLPPAAVAAFAGWALGAAVGALVGVLAAGLGSVLAQRAIAPWLCGSLFPFMRERPRAALVRSLCGPGTARATAGVVLLRLAPVMPLPLTNVLFAVTRVPSVAVAMGSALALAPVVSLAALVGDAARSLRDDGVWPQPGRIAAAATLLLVCAAAIVQARRVRRRRAAAGCCRGGAPSSDHRREGRLLLTAWRCGSPSSRSACACPTRSSASPRRGSSRRPSA
jgi:uncharacterized membrane protein YdjX (TVP38/TMEM64 family)